jgi:soluble lytic murein transglycosylase
MTTTWRNRTRVLGLLGGWITLVLLFQNMTWTGNQVQPALPPVNNTVRVIQAQELLGKKYHGSFAEKSEGKSSLSQHIYKKVQQALPAKWKNKASEVASAIIAESEAQGLDPIFILAVIKTESNFNPEARGSHGDSGLMQILPETAKWIANINGISWEGSKALFDPVYNIKIGVAYFAHLRGEFDSVPTDYIRAYHVGPKNLKRAKGKVANAKKKNAKATTQMNSHILNKLYARKVMKTYALLYKEASVYNKSTQ